MTERTAQQHPIKLLSYTTRYFWLLIIPIVRSLYSLSLDANAFKTWLKGTWFDLIVVAAILVFAWLRLVSVTFTFDHEKIIVRRGIFVAAQDVVWYKEISTLSIKQGFLYRLVGASTVYIGTNAGIFDKADITLVMKRSDADRLYASVKGSRAKSLNYSISTNRLKLLIFSILSSSTLSGVIVALAFIVETWQVFDREVEARIILDTLSEFADRLSVIVPPIAAGISIIIAGSWLISFITNVFYFWGYVLTKCSDSLYLKSGLLSRNRHIIKLDRINYIDLKQSFLARMLRISSLHCQCSGYGSTGRSELSVVMPITSSREISGAISEVFPRLSLSAHRAEACAEELYGVLLLACAFMRDSACRVCADKRHAPDMELGCANRHDNSGDTDCVACCGQDAFRVHDRHRHERGAHHHALFPQVHLPHSHCAQGQDYKGCFKAERHAAHIGKLHRDNIHILGQQNEASHLRAEA